MEREHALEIQVARGARAKLEDRCNRLEDVVHDQETILQVGSRSGTLRVLGEDERMK